MDFKHVSGTLALTPRDDYRGKRVIFSVYGPRGGRWADFSVPHEAVLQVGAALDKGESIHLDRAGDHPGLLVSCEGDTCQVLVKEPGANAFWCGFSLHEEQAEALAAELCGKQHESVLAEAIG